MAVGFQHRAGPNLGELRARLQGVRGAVFRARLAQNLAEEARHQVDEEFREERDPYGVPWEPIKYRQGKILQDTGRMAASTATRQVNADGFQIVIGATYAAYHQFGAFVPPHSRIRPTEMLRNPRTGRLVKKNTRLKSVRRSVIARRTFAKGIVIPRRQMLPSSDRGGLGLIWSKAFAKVTKKMLADQIEGAG